MGCLLATLYRRRNDETVAVSERFGTQDVKKHGKHTDNPNDSPILRFSSKEKTCFWTIDPYWKVGRGLVKTQNRSDGTKNYFL